MSRRLLLPLAAALLAASCSGGAAGPAPDALPGAGTSAAPGTTAAVPGVGAVLLEVLDGDSFRASLDGEPAEVRLLGINAPEAGECFGPEARRAAAALLEGGSLVLQLLPEPDQFGRLLAYAYVDGLLVNRALLDGGYALALHTDHARLAEFLAADDEAHAARVGMWASDACGTPSRPAPIIVEIVADPPGPDQDDPNGEWVLLAADGGTALDLSGWTLRDESSEHRYPFPAGTVLAAGGQVRVHTGCGRDSGEDLFWCADGPVWNNGGDTALLLDPRGNVAARRRYPG